MLLAMLSTGIPMLTSGPKFKLYLTTLKFDARSTPAGCPGLISRTTPSGFKASGWDFGFGISSRTRVVTVAVRPR